MREEPRTSESAHTNPHAGADEKPKSFLMKYWHILLPLALLLLTTGEDPPKKGEGKKDK